MFGDGAADAAEHDEEPIDMNRLLHERVAQANSNHDHAFLRGR
jgi:hypothetical protein